jgi:hypothetical protein
MTYYLSSLESVRFGKARKCTFVKRMRFDTGKECALVKLAPPVAGQPWGLAKDLEAFVLAARHAGKGLFPISEFPCFVHIARLLSDDVMEKDVVAASELETVAWGELYRSREDAEKHVFD